MDSGRSGQRRVWPLNASGSSASSGPSRLADLVVVDGDPLRDITLLQKADRIRLVWKGGRICVDRRMPREVSANA